MTIEELAAAVIAACTEEQVDYMITGAFAANLYGIPRATHDVDFVIDVPENQAVQNIIARLDPKVRFDTQTQFDTQTWGRRHVGTARDRAPVKVELFEIFDDPFVLEQFQRRKSIPLKDLGGPVSVPTAEDLVVQKLRWGRRKDLDDARDILAVQGPETLDMLYIKRWCAIHETVPLLHAALQDIPPRE